MYKTCSCMMASMKKKAPPRLARQRQRTIYLPEAIDKKVRVLAAQRDTTVSVAIAQALKAYFAAERKARKKVD